MRDKFWKLWKGMIQNISNSIEKIICYDLHGNKYEDEG